MRAHALRVGYVAALTLVPPGSTADVRQWPAIDPASADYQRDLASILGAPMPAAHRHGGWQP